MVSRRDKVEIENSGAEVSEEAVEVEVTRCSFEISPTRRVPEPEYSEGASKRSRGPDRVRKENSNEETWGHAGICSRSRWAALIASCAKPYHEENERYVFVATNINLPYWQEAQAGFLDAARALA